MSPLDDGTYDAVVVDAVEARVARRDDAHETLRDDPSRAGALHLEVVITSGARKGEVIAINTEDATSLLPATRDAIDLLGLPVTLVVVNGSPRVVVDPSR